MTFQSIFQDRHHNRHEFPTKHVLICEDCLDLQTEVMKHFSSKFSSQGKVQFSLVSGGKAAAGVISWTKIDLIILDYDMPNGNGEDLINWLKISGLHIPIITFSGLEMNNKKLMELGANHFFSKNNVLRGLADRVINEILGV